MASIACSLTIKTNIDTVIGESVVIPSSIVYKLRISPPSASVAKKDLSVEESKHLAQVTAKEDEQFLSTREDAEDLDASSTNGYAHAPHWPGVSIHFTRPISYFCLLFFIRLATDADWNYHTLWIKIQFQCPSNSGLFTWKIYIDTFAGEEAKIDIAVGFFCFTSSFHLLPTHSSVSAGEPPMKALKSSK